MHRSPLTVHRLSPPLPAICSQLDAMTNLRELDPPAWCNNLQPAECAASYVRFDWDPSLRHQIVLCVPNGPSGCTGGGAADLYSCPEEGAGRRLQGGVQP